MLPYAFGDEGKADLDQHYTYLSERSPAAARRLLASIVAAIEQACMFPDAAPRLIGVDEPGDVSGTRKLIEAAYRYVIYYRVVDGVLVVLRIYHPSQQR